MGGTFLRPRGAGEGRGDGRVWSGARRHPQRGEGLEFTLGKEKVPPGAISNCTLPVCVSVLQKSLAGNLDINVCKRKT